MSLYQKLATVLSTREIDELGLLHAPPDQVPPDAESYLPLVVIDTKLGIPFDQLHIILREAHELFIALRSSSSNCDTALDQVSKVMSLLKPDNYTATNARRQLVLRGAVSATDELKLIDLIFTIPRHAKSANAWHYRLWLFEHAKAPLDIQNELDLCTRSVRLYPRNYYAWNHRQWLLKSMDAELLVAEYYQSLQWVERNKEEHLQWIEQLILRYPGHEALWCHRRFCATIFHDVDHHTFITKYTENRGSAFDTDAEAASRQDELALRFGIWLCYSQKGSDEKLLKTYQQRLLRYDNRSFS